MQNGTLLAAVDLGSNSFRLEIGRLDHGQIQRTEYLKETVRQGNGLDADRNLSLAAMQRGWDCLARFGERLAGLRELLRARATVRQRRTVAQHKVGAVLGFETRNIHARRTFRPAGLAGDAKVHDVGQRGIIESAEQTSIRQC